MGLKIKAPFVIAAGRVQLPVIPIIVSCAVVMMMMMTTTTAGCLSSLPPPPHVVIVSPDDGSFVPHWCNRHCWTFSDLSPNYTLRTRDEPIKKEGSESMLPNRGSSVCLPVTYFAAVVLQQTKHTKSQEKHEKLSNSSETHFRP